MGRPPADDRRNVSEGAWYRTVVEPAKSVLIESPEALESVVNAARDMYDRALTDARELGQRIDAARNLDAGAGEAFLLRVSHMRTVMRTGFLNPPFLIIGLRSRWTDAQILEYYDQQNSGPGAFISRGSAASPLGFWDG